MKSNFAHMKSTLVFDDLKDAENYGNVKPHLSGFLLRRALEILVAEIFQLRNLPKSDYSTTLDRMMQEASFQRLLNRTAPIDSYTQWDRIRKLGNDAVHPDKLLTFRSKDALLMLKRIHSFCQWYMKTIRKVPSREYSFDESLVPDRLPEDLLTERYEAEIRKREENHKIVIQALNETNDRMKVQLEHLRNHKIVNPLEFLDVGITEQEGLIWGRVYVNFKHLEEPYYAVKYFKNINGAKEQFYLTRGRYQQSAKYRDFQKKHQGFHKDVVLSGTFDNLELVKKFSKERFGTPSILLKKLVQEITSEMRSKEIELQENHAQEELAAAFDFYGSFYKHESQLYRNLLTINRKNTSQGNYNAIVVMINPGGSYPIEEESVVAGTPTNHNQIELAPCVPDETQYQICRLMNHQGWNNVSVINIFDICEPNANVTYQRYSQNKAHLVESIFHQERRAEFESLDNQLSDEGPFILAWGTDDSISNIKKQAMAKVLEPAGRRILGVQKEDVPAQYYHPSPRPKGENNIRMREQWPQLVHEQLTQPIDN